MIGIMSLVDLWLTKYIISYLSLDSTSQQTFGIAQDFSLVGNSATENFIRAIT